MTDASSSPPASGRGDDAAATTLEQLRRMTPEQLDAARICQRCWEHYGVCVCGERKVRELRSLKGGCSL